MNPSTMDEIHVFLENTNNTSWHQSLLTCVITVISGVLVFIIGQYLLTIWVQPLQKYKEIRQKISYSLTYYAQYYSNVIDNAHGSLLEETSLYEKGGDEIRKLASELRGFSETISWFHLGIPNKKVLYETSSILIGLSNSFFSPEDCILDTIKHNIESVERIKKNMKMHE